MCFGVIIVFFAPESLRAPMEENKMPVLQEAVEVTCMRGEG